MKSVAITFLFVFLVLWDVASSQSITECDKCEAIFCTQDHNPVCGKKDLGSNVWEQRIFGNQCKMDSENLCGGGYIPCCYFERPSFATDLTPSSQS